MRGPGGVHEGVWRLVSLCALCAMDHGRRQMSARVREGSAQPGLELSNAVGRLAVLRFWEVLTEFVSLGDVPESWLESAGAGPFIYFSGQSQQWVVARSAGAT